MRQAAFSMWHRRWSAIISIAARRALAASLLSLPEIFGAGGDIPSFDDILGERRYEVEVEDRSISESVPLDGPSGVQQVADHSICENDMRDESIPLEGITVVQESVDVGWSSVQVLSASVRPPKCALSLPRGHVVGDEP